jgi:hypothetical protein
MLTYMASVTTHTCQQALINLDTNFNRVRIEQIITIGANTSVVADGIGINYADNLDVTGTTPWSQISLFDAPSLGDSPDEIPDYELPDCDWTKTYASLDALQSDAANVDPYCATIFALPILQSMLSEALTK